MSSRRQRFQDEPGYILHTSAWRETSLICQAFSRNHGLVPLVAKGAKRPHSVLRPALSVFQPLLLSWTGQNEVKTLTRADCAGIRPLKGRALMSAWYMNELLIRLLPREDPHPVLYEAYEAALAHLAQQPRPPVAGALRRFEWVLLTETGYGFEDDMPDFDDAQREPELRILLRERINSLLGRPLHTRTVLMQLQRY
ncbi:DNA repair protein RecO [Alcaligenes sp. SDU_A2]|uniref:DNA repair protein RecO n=1 Tax=Alcaligenes sp. SDU_A2 TaxID=3136634 RepID=UPI002BF80C00|nr:DNA repair protein RecO [Alcaligenes sp.]HRL28526.1 DNA repair protein RecO [Alcaligenes sp.]